MRRHASHCVPSQSDAVIMSAVFSPATLNAFDADVTAIEVSATIVLANVAEIAAIYALRFFGLDDLAENPVIKVSLGLCSLRSSPTSRIAAS
jgi:hypothetical protein